MKDLLGAAFGVGLVAFGLATERDNHILVGTLTAVAFLFLFLQDRKRRRESAESFEGPPSDDASGS